jgi:hypothetical protein
MFALLTRRDGANSLSGSFRHTLNQPAACAEGEEQEGQKKRQEAGGEGRPETSNIQHRTSNIE